jgi:hypothetical protein
MELGEIVIDTQEAEFTSSKVKVGMYGEVDQAALKSIPKYYLQDFRGKEDKIGEVIASLRFKIIMLIVIFGNISLWINLISFIFEDEIKFELYQKIIYGTTIITWPFFQLPFCAWFIECLYRILRYKFGIKLTFLGLEY